MVKRKNAEIDQSILLIVKNTINGAVGTRNVNNSELLAFYYSPDPCMILIIQGYCGYFCLDCFCPYWVIHVLKTYAERSIF